MSGRLTRVVLVTSMAAGLGVVVTGAGAAGHDIEVTSDPSKCDTTYGPPCFTPGNGTVTKVGLGDTVTWYVRDGTHTVTPVDPAAFQGSEDLEGPDATFSVTFDRPGVYTFYCRRHGSVEPDGETYHGMWGKIDVGDAGGGAATTTTSEPTTTTAPAQPEPAPETPPPPPPPPPAPPPAPPPPPPPPPVPSPAATSPPTTHRPAPPPPPPAPPATASAAKAQKAPKSTGHGGTTTTATTTTTTAQPPAPPLPPLVLDAGPIDPAATTSSTAPLGSPPPAPPEGNAVAVLDDKPARRGTKTLVAAAVGMAALGLGVAGWRFAHRPSKYWPA